MLLITVGKGVWLLENPGTSLISYHDRFRWLVRVLRLQGHFVPRLGLGQTVKLKPHLSGWSCARAA